MKEPKPRCSGTMTESQYLAWIRSALRSKSLKWKPRSDCINAARRPYKGSNKLQKWEVECALCKNWFKLKEIHVDHFPKEAGSILSVDDIGQFCNNLFCEITNLRCLCESCHSVHTLASRNNISWDEALLEKDVNHIMRESKQDIIEFILAHDFNQEYNTNNEPNRKEAVRAILKGASV
jgi:hypothetical protein